ncbi:MAG: hypothetical protein Q4G58_17735 [bacterium]|nr:hypothetical protein [bacterium]
MKTIIMYYTFSGNSRKEAERLANEYQDVVVCEVTEQRKRNMLSAVSIGCPMAMVRGASKIKEVAYDLKQFDRILLIAPVWSGFPAPAFNAMVKRLPEGKEVGIYLCSSGGEAPKSKEGTCKMIADKNCKLISYQDIKTWKTTQAM